MTDGVLDLQRHTHRRLNILTGDWVLVSPHRTNRPWQGQIEQRPADAVPSFDPECYMCPGNRRASGARNPAYTGTFVFPNDFAALQPDAPPHRMSIDDLFVAAGEPGICRVVCFSPRHDLTLSRMAVEEIRRVIDVCVEQSRELGRHEEIQYVQIFENRGAMMGASNPHPHGQIWATTTLPNEVAKEQRQQTAYFDRLGRDLLGDYLALEQRQSARVICRNAHFAALVPFWAVWPFETMVISTRQLGAIDELSTEERASLADVLKRLTTRYDNLFQSPFPYSMGLHVQPADGELHPEWRLHAHFYPPLLRSASIRKFMVGYELLATPQRDITPERAAERLRGSSERHYSE